jgi:hypothetical protein
VSPSYGSPPDKGTLVAEGGGTPKDLPSRFTFTFKTIACFVLTPPEISASTELVLLKTFKSVEGVSTRTSGIDPFVDFWGRTVTFFSIS